MLETLLSLPPHLRRQLRTALDSGLVAPPYSIAAIRSATGVADGSDEVIAALTELERAGMAGRNVATLLDAFDEAESRAPRPDLVWSGPEVPGLFARDTRRVYEELLGSAERSVWASTYAFFDGPKAFEVLSQRMDSIEDLEVTLLLNIERKWGDTSARDELVRRFADRFWGIRLARAATPECVLLPALPRAGPADRGPARKGGRQGRRHGLHHLGELD